MEQLEMLCDKLGVALNELVDAYAPYLFANKVACAVGFAVAIAIGVAVSLAILGMRRRHVRSEFGIAPGSPDSAELRELTFEWLAFTFGVAALFSVFIIIFAADAVTCAIAPRGYAIEHLVNLVL